MKLILCPDCGKLLSPRFPIHDCKPRKRNYNYPACTKGSDIARHIRAKANKLTPKQRAMLLRMGMRRIRKGQKT